MAEFRYSVKNKNSMLLHITRCMVFLLVIVFPALSMSKIKDGIVCSECHTMHNSQEGSSMTPAAMEAQEALLNNSCAGCHSGTNSAFSIAAGTPFVFDPNGEPAYDQTGTEPGTTTLAGGNFYWVQSGDPDEDRKGHNVAGIADEDDIYSLLYGGGGRPPIPGSNPSTQLVAQLTCAGSTGCHGNGNGSDIESLKSGSKGSHHADETLPLDGLSVSQSFRFLSGIKGLEASDWEFIVDSANHNQYQGSVAVGTDTISALCARCHGFFHTSAGSPFLRHPTDYDMNTSGEYAAYATYKPETPLASVDVTATLEDVSGVNNRIVTCISCHRAHGTPYDALLRWDYKSWPGAGAYDGCGQCHSTKN